METPAKYTVDYNKIFKIELLNECSNAVYARLMNFVYNTGIGTKDKNNLYVALLDPNLFEKSFEELEALEKYWEYRNKCIKEITK